ncbi:trypsin [Amycolatopsis sp. MJM2582]|uniref:S1 family peptidase n=1 Tax=Amycolatopsis TaxID=1813 RepID=UPI000502D914|nr:serine protease [Amycolatopsis sp. MJM2582]KFZ83108.1 trypsin [Amycolatopsis sp. MJM2582]
MRTRSLVAGLLTGAAAVLGLAMPASAAEPPSGVQPLIVGGVDATETYTFMASMQTKSGDHNCGASLIAPEWLVTAAHCVEGEQPSNWQYRINTTDHTKGGEVAEVDKFVVHEKYDGSGPYDIALVHLTKAAEAAPIEIGQSPQAGTDVREIGWGLTCPTRGCGEAPVVLQQLDTKIAEDSGCSGSGAYDAESELCMDNQGGKASACYGDSGGPAVVKAGDKWTLVGATSRGQTASCPEMPGIYTDVTAFTDWIKQQTGK